jgi:hypothetical protein
MAVSSRRVASVLAVFVLAALFVPTALAGKRDTPAKATLYVKYTMGCTFSIEDDQGRPVSSVPPGEYQIYVSTPVMFKLVVPGGEGVDHLVPGDYTGCRGWVQFQVTGPGVNLYTTLDSGCDAFYLLPASNFVAGQSYAFTELSRPALTRTVINVQNSGAPALPNSPYTSTGGKTFTQKDLVGSNRIEGVRASRSAALKGTLSGTLSAGGKLGLTRLGKPVSKLTAGRYRFVIDDKDAENGFVLQALKKRASGLTGTSFVGKRSVIVTLTAGRWMYFSVPGKARYFRVT